MVFLDLFSTSYFLVVKTQFNSISFLPLCVTLFLTVSSEFNPSISIHLPLSQIKKIYNKSGSMRSAPQKWLSPKKASQKYFFLLSSLDRTHDHEYLLIFHRLVRPQNIRALYIYVMYNLTYRYLLL
jgi:hypothetical protein